MAKLSYFVLSCHDLGAPRRFYEALGLHFQEEEHGAGPVHFSTAVSGVVLELYPAKAGGAEAADPRRLGIVVESISVVVAALEASGAKPIPSGTGAGPKSVCCLDPDARVVEIVEA